MDSSHWSESQSLVPLQLCLVGLEFVLQLGHHLLGELEGTLERLLPLRALCEYLSLPHSHWVWVPQCVLENFRVSREICRCHDSLLLSREEIVLLLRCQCHSVNEMDQMLMVMSLGFHDSEHSLIHGMPRVVALSPPTSPRRTTKNSHKASSTISKILKHHNSTVSTRVYKIDELLSSMVHHCYESVHLLVEQNSVSRLTPIPSSQISEK